jgi:hypothetical protein
VHCADAPGARAAAGGFARVQMGLIGLWSSVMTMFDKYISPVFVTL